ncbi:hypothetical protein [Maridesulfovibrio bastinii]|jgi:hypothetical protein|uniref:hypothetical protein n=1 Tax=Maridesulfovibrio bastinii TaxID=47157 RepID=UPI00040AD7FD|nr:hypothetical protein [Maridesulfovibrio bastinii]
MYAIGAFKAWNASRKSNRSDEVNHSIHAVLTLATLGLWLPVWTVVCIRHAKKVESMGKSSLIDLRKIERLEISPEYKSRLARSM